MARVNRRALRQLVRDRIMDYHELYPEAKLSEVVAAVSADFRDEFGDTEWLDILLRLVEQLAPQLAPLLKIIVDVIFDDDGQSATATTD